MTESADQSVHLKKGDQESELSQQQIQRMIDYISEHTDYKIITDGEFQLLNRPMAHSTPTAWGGARPKNTNTVKFEEPPTHTSQSDTCSGFVFDSSTVRPRFSIFSGEKNVRHHLMCGRMMYSVLLEMVLVQQTLLCKQ